MGKILGNNITSSFSGALGDDLVFRRIGGRTFFARKGVNRKPPSPSQNSRRSLFADAQQYASEAMEQPETSEWYSIVAKMNNLRTAQLAAIKDFMSSPEIEIVDEKKYEGRPGNIICIKPKMLLKIEKMEIAIHGADGKMLESGLAMKTGLAWKYRATAINPQVSGSKVIVVAHDRLEKSCTVVTHLY